MIKFNWYAFSELTVAQLYAALILRSEIFVVEQQCPFLEPDGNDTFALHLFGMHQDTLVAYLRLFAPTETDNYLVFGRIVTAKSTRGTGAGKKLMVEMLRYCAENFPRISIKCFAQAHLQKFYEDYGFRVCGEAYDEDGIMHLPMQKES
jgi:ElaA protein